MDLLDGLGMLDTPCPLKSPLNTVTQVDAFSLVIAMKR